MAASKTVVVTGANIGLGFETVKAIAQEDDGWHIILACRSKEKADEAIIQIKETLPQDKRERVVLESMILDLNSLKSVHSFASTFKTRLQNNEIPPFKSLICNAGLQNTSLKFTEEGYEQTFGVNHLGHFLLVLLIADSFTAPARIMIVASGTHDPLEKTGLPIPVYTSGEKLAHPDIEHKDYGIRYGQQCYTNSKLCNVLFAYELNRRLLASGISTTDKLISVNAYDPGLVPGTGLARDHHWLGILVFRALSPLFKYFIPNTHTGDESGGALAALGTKDEYKGITGKYFNVLKEKKSSELSYDETLQKELWESSIKLCNLQQNETSIPLGAIN